MPFPDPQDKILRDVLSGHADLKMVIWSKNREILENELQYPKRKYEELFVDFLQKEMNKLVHSSQQKTIEAIFYELNRKDDMMLEIMKQMDFAKRYNFLISKNT